MKNRILSVMTLIVATSAIAATVDPTKPMVTGRGNVVAARPDKVQVTNQVAPADSADTQVLEKYVVTGSLLPKAAAAPAKSK